MDGIVKRARKAVSARQVPDSWDDDEDNVEDEEDNSFVAGTSQFRKRPSIEMLADGIHQGAWDTGGSAPMPTVILGAPLTAGSSLPPPSALGPTMRILKRPVQNSSSSSTDSVRSPQSLAEREAAYAVARERIFGDFSFKISPVAKDHLEPSANDEKNVKSSSTSHTPLPPSSTDDKATVS
ncbi:uncharacterized protein EI90DRAFT_3159824 [Cantharellus anzutake]|uniref:uncharacterized protein n=1 Tax=Cantharellus anzutake TaxID=1750568 RepID=UPI0019054450|nr:uncharacterized protein EI90DRAFT_3159824 [Cantharellus anzutake]KAF8312892.1 hypothetical protein EI90DRAFT_3159824 [Cantharellus anzutake]